MQFEQTELVALFLGVVFIIPTAIIFRVASVPRIGYLLGAMIFSLLAAFFTVIEGLAWPAGFNVLEHTSYALAALFLAAAAWLLVRDGAGDRRRP